MEWVKDSDVDKNIIFEKKNFNFKNTIFGGFFVLPGELLFGHHVA